MLLQKQVDLVVLVVLVGLVVQLVVKWESNLQMEVGVEQFQETNFVYKILFLHRF